ncbi:MAG: site-specific DNA-methyltransferase [Clostridia bacterium]|nr:site-specific DNA-methyltransferase [Clostridia bacterium]
MSLYYQDGGIKIYQEDNIELLRRLPDRSINLIYCDILYNTGKVFDDYSDNLGSPKEAMEWYRPRFEEMKRVLADNGSIFIHCNWRLDSYMRILMDEIFGERNFRNRIYRKHSAERGFYANFDSQVDIILYYVKDSGNFVFKEQHGTSPRVVPLFENGYLEGRSEIRIFNGEEINLEKRNKHWLISQKQFDDMVKKNQVQIINGLPYRFSTVVPVGNLWYEDCMLDDYTRTDVAEVYDTPKPDAVLERIISTCSNEGDTVADFFMGGGTTAVVAKRLGRKGVFCDINRKACCATMKKLENLK